MIILRTCGSFDFINFSLSQTSFRKTYVRKSLRNAFQYLIKFLQNSTKLSALCGSL